MKKYQINLIQKKKQDLTDTIIYFFLHYLRYIIVLTQIVVIGVFFFRFQVDQEIIDLKESIDQKSEIIKVTKPLIAEAYAIDARVKEIRKIIDNQVFFSKNINYLFSIIPENIILNKFEFENKKIIMKGQASTIEIVNLLTERLKKDKNFKSVTLSELARMGDFFSFSVQIITN